MVQDARSLRSALQRIKPFPDHRLLIGPTPEAELEAAVTRFLEIFGRRQSLTVTKTRLALVYSSTFTPHIGEALSNAEWGKDGVPEPSHRRATGQARGRQPGRVARAIPEMAEPLTASELGVGF